MIVSIKEFEKLQIKEKRNLSKKIISREDAAKLQMIVVNNESVFSWNNKYLSSQHWVGVVNLGAYSIEILPKLYGHVSDELLRDTLVRMLLVTNQAPSVKDIFGAVQMKKNSLSEMLISTFLVSVGEYIEEGFNHTYVKAQGNLDKVKGKIIINKQFYKNPLNVTKFFCRYSVFTENNFLNKFFKICLKEMGLLSSDKANIDTIREYLNYFSAIDSIDLETAIVEEVVFNSTNYRAEEAYKYGKMFIKNIFATMNAGSTEINTMLFDMNLLYEQFIFKIARHVFGQRVLYQHHGNYLIRKNENEKRYINLRPDITLHKADDSVVIIDTKWKLPKTFAKESDVYQMNAYMTGIEHLEKAYLLYPKVDDNDEQYVGDYTFNSFDGQQHSLGVRTVDLTKCLNWNDFSSDIKEMFT